MSDLTRVRRSIFLRNNTRVVPVASGGSLSHRPLTMSGRSDSRIFACLRPSRPLTAA